jgi:hypothetical protein
MHPKPTGSTQKPPTQTATAAEKPEESTAASKEASAPTGKGREMAEHWHILVWSQPPLGMVCEFSFAVLFPRYREKYIRKVCNYEKKLVMRNAQKDLTLVFGCS